MNLEAALRVEVRPYADEDEQQTLDLLQAALGAGPAGGRSREFFRWKHLQNPFGRSFMLVAESGGRIVGLRAFMAWRLQAGETSLRALRAVDTATHPDYQGRGIFSRLTREAIEVMGNNVDLVFNTPNGASLPGYLKLGWRVVGKFPVAVRIRRPVAFAARAKSFRSLETPVSARPAVAAPTAAEVLADEHDVSALLQDTAPEVGLATPRDLAYLRWRYAACPSLDYYAVCERGERGLRALAIFRVRPRGALWETSIVELIARRGERDAARRVLRRAVRAVKVDHVTCRFIEDRHEALALSTCFVRSPVGATFVVKTFRDDIRPAPAELGSWALAIGDLEVF